MSDANLPYHAQQAIGNPALIEVFDRLETHALEQLLAVKGWKRSIVEAKRQAILDDVSAIRRIRSELELMARGAMRRTNSVA